MAFFFVAAAFYAGVAYTTGSFTRPVGLILLAIGAVLIAVGADLLVDNGTLIAQALGVPESVIALTFVALGTSLPELVTAITSLAKGHGALSLGNVIGANVFNLVLVSGVSVTLAPFSIPQNSTIAGMNASLVMDIPVMFAVMLLTPARSDQGQAELPAGHCTVHLCRLLRRAVQHLICCKRKIFKGCCTGFCAAAFLCGMILNALDIFPGAVEVFPQRRAKSTAESLLMMPNTLAMGFKPWATPSGERTRERLRGRGKTLTALPERVKKWVRSAHRRF